MILAPSPPRDGNVKIGYGQIPVYAHVSLQ